MGRSKSAVSARPARRWAAPALAFTLALCLAVLAAATNLATALPIPDWLNNGWVLWPAAGVLAALSAVLAALAARAPADPAGPSTVIETATGRRCRTAVRPWAR